MTLGFRNLKGVQGRLLGILNIWGIETVPRGHLPTVLFCFLAVYTNQNTVTIGLRRSNGNIDAGAFELRARDALWGLRPANFPAGALSQFRGIKTGVYGAGTA